MIKNFNVSIKLNRQLKVPDETPDYFDKEEVHLLIEVFHVKELNWICRDFLLKEEEKNILKTIDVKIRFFSLRLT